MTTTKKKTTARRVGKKHLPLFWAVHERLKAAEEDLYQAGWDVVQMAILRKGLHTPWPVQDNMPTMFAAAEAARCPIVELVVRHRDAEDLGRCLLICDTSAGKGGLLDAVTVPGVDLAKHGLVAAAARTTTGLAA